MITVVTNRQVKVAGFDGYSNGDGDAYGPQLPTPTVDVPKVPNAPLPGLGGSGYTPTKTPNKKSVKKVQPVIAQSPPAKPAPKKSGMSTGVEVAIGVGAVTVLIIALVAIVKK